jgi:hypothetical protein
MYVSIVWPQIGSSIRHFTVVQSKLRASRVCQAPLPSVRVSDARCVPCTVRARAVRLSLWASVEGSSAPRRKGPNTVCVAGRSIRTFILEATLFFRPPRPTDPANLLARRLPCSPACAAFALFTGKKEDPRPPQTRKTAKASQPPTARPWHRPRPPPVPLHARWHAR